MDEAVDLRKEILIIPKLTVPDILIEGIRIKYGISHEIDIDFRWIWRNGEEELQVMQSFEQSTEELVYNTRHEITP